MSQKTFDRIALSAIVALVVLISASFVLNIRAVRRSNVELQQVIEQTARHDGIVEGCVEMFIFVAGPAPSQADMDSLVRSCGELADELMEGAKPEHVVPQTAPLPTVAPGSTL